jgi:glycosyltransferase involved in cell wall biosynthesis
VTRPPGRVPLLLVVGLYPDGGGIAAIVENLVALLGPAYDVHVAIVDFRPESGRRLALPPERVHVLASHHLLKPMVAPTSLVYPVRVGRVLRRLVRRLRPAAVLVQDGLFLPVPGLLATRGTGAKLVVMDHGTLTNSLDPAWQRLFAHQFEGWRGGVFRLGWALDRPWREARWRLGLRHASAVWYVGQEVAPFVARAGGLGERYAQLVPADFAPPSPDERRAARRRLDVADDVVVVNMVTRLAAEKGLPEIVAAVGEVADAHPELVLLVVGDGDLEEWLRGEVAHRRLPLRLLGRRDRAGVLDVHHASDFHLYAGTIGCGMSVALLEAMASGVVPIVSDVPREQRELVGDAGWVVRAGDAGELTQALRAALATSPAERDELRRRTLARVRAYAEPSLLSLVERLLAA